MNLHYWRYHLDPAPILGDPHVALASTLLGIGQRLEAVLALLGTLSDDRPLEREYGVTVAGMAVAFALKVLRHIGLGDDSPAPSFLNLPMARMVMENLLATVDFYLDQWRQGVCGEADGDSAATPEGLIIDPGTFTVTYKGKSCELGITKAFRLLERLNQRPGIYVHLDTLKQDVWHDEYAEDWAVQRQASTLRTKLRAAGIEGVVIDGDEPRHYRLTFR